MYRSRANTQQSTAIYSVLCCVYQINIKRALLACALCRLVFVLLLLLADCSLLDIATNRAIGISPVQLSATRCQPSFTQAIISTSEGGGFVVDPFYMFFFFVTVSFVPDRASRGTRNGTWSMYLKMVSYI